MLQRYTRYFHHFRIQWNIHCNLYILMVICIAYIIILFLPSPFYFILNGFSEYTHLYIHVYEHYTDIWILTSFLLVTFLLFHSYEVSVYLFPSIGELSVISSSDITFLRYSYICRKFAYTFLSVTYSFIWFLRKKK